MTDPNSPADEPKGEQPLDEQPDESSTTTNRLRRYLDRALLVAFLLLAAVAALQFYFQVGAAIEVWIAEPYEPVVKAGFNLAVLLFAAAGLSYQLRRVDSIRPGTDPADPAGE
ncbi:hypothetical protein AArcSl_0210 [Halalkaliarchaeum desulfuricum]|uniref:DUF8060 domain-containing protein n=1 Tax=Halalkaliarchaeum desulfuricum TaxID=2055893 RepID=A0A343TFJ3_9EURY|nr:hypothetical protein [Halalkaliarchaeum desulfuricum]AUX07865.1 hypothetical protein AArcSl_0210 [Halalkaliarchaeum desulfuricum]